MMRKTKIANKKTDQKRGVDHIGISVSFVVHDGKGKILLQKRGPKCRDEQGRWDIGGGAIEFGETIEDTLVREIKEELCTKPLKSEFLTVYDAHRGAGDKCTHWVAIIYAVLVDPAKVRIGEPEKIDEIGWFSSDTLPSPLHSQFYKSYSVALDNGIAK